MKNSDITFKISTVIRSELLCQEKGIIPSRKLGGHNTDFLTNPKYRGSHKLDQLTELQGVVLSLQRANCRKAVQKECQGLSRKPNIADYRVFCWDLLSFPNNQQEILVIMRELLSSLSRVQRCSDVSLCSGKHAALWGALHYR